MMVTEREVSKVGDLVALPAALATRIDGARLIELWMEGRSPQTLRAYTNDLHHYSDWLGKFVGGTSLSPAEAVTTLLAKPQGEANECVRAYRSAMIERGLSPSTINRRLSALRSLVTLGKELGLASFDLATRNVRAEPYRDTRGPEPDAMAALIQHALSHPNKPKATRDVAIFLLLGYGRALRRGEVVGLDLEHFDPRGSRLSVLRKGKRERQWLSLDQMVMSRLRAWIVLRGKEPGPLFLQLGKGNRVLPGRRLSGDGIHKILQTMGAKLGGVIRPHGLRHAAITAALDETNGNVRAAREFSGHASVEVLMRYDDNRKDVGGEVASKVMRRLSKLLDDAKG
jgi:integrase/recombinase XerC